MYRDSFIIHSLWYCTSCNKGNGGKPKLCSPLERYLRFFHEKIQVEVLWFVTSCILPHHTAPSKFWRAGLQFSRALNNCTEQSPSWGQLTVNQLDRIPPPRLIWNPTDYYHIHNTPSLVRIQS